MAGGYRAGATIPRSGAAARVHLIPKRRVGAGEQALATALQPWEQQLLLEGVGRWSVRGAIVALAAASGVLAVGWVIPWPEAELQPWAARVALPLVLLALVVALWPPRRIRRASDLDRRLSFGDRLATAWAFRDSAASIASLQRADAIARLETRSPRTELRRRPARLELAALGSLLGVAVILLLVPSPQQRVLEQRATEQAHVEQATQRLDLLREQAATAPSLTVEQARQLDELLKQAQAELAQVRTQREATAILAQTADQLTQQMADANASLRDEALAAMSETLATEPLSQPLADALQHEDAQAASQALQSLAAQADQLSDVQRQGLSRALQRAANVGRSDPATSNALRDAARAVASGESSADALSAADKALHESMQASASQAALRATTQEMRDLQSRLASGAPLDANASKQNGVGAQPGAGLAGTPMALGTPVAVDAGGATGTEQLADPSGGHGLAGGYGPGSNLGDQTGTSGVADAAENVFIPGRISNGNADNLDQTNQPFTVRGAPRPYRDVLTQYAQTGREYIDRPDVSPAVRELVKQYFQHLEEGQ